MVSLFPLFSGKQPGQDCSALSGTTASIQAGADSVKPGALQTYNALNARWSNDIMVWAVFSIVHPNLLILIPAEPLPYSLRYLPASYRQRSKGCRASKDALYMS